MAARPKTVRTAGLSCHVCKSCNTASGLPIYSLGTGVAGSRPGPWLRSGSGGQLPFQHVFWHIARFEWITAGVVFALVVLTMAAAIVRYRARPGRAASQNTEHTKVEVAYAGVLLAVAGFIVAYTVQPNAADALKTHPAASIRVTGFQWCWTFTYEERPVT